MFGQTLTTHQHDREEHAKRLSLSLAEFDRLLESANNAHAIFTKLGPFYGREDVTEPTFRITAEPVKLPHGAEKTLRALGDDLLHFGRSLAKLPEEARQQLGTDLDYFMPPTWRIDAIVTSHGQIKVNEIEGVDGANALMMGEQFAYNLQELSESTASKLIPTLKAMSMTPHDGMYKIALLKVNVPTDTTIPNARRFMQYIHTISKGTVQMELFDAAQVQSGEVKIDWGRYHGVINETFISPKELYALGMHKRQLLAAGNYNALGNKGAFALLFDTGLTSFFVKELGEERLGRLRDTLIPSRFVYTEKEIEEARRSGKVLKVSWAGTNTLLINRSRGVAMPKGDLEHSSEERWKILREFFLQGLRVIEQDFVEPAKIHAFLRKRGTTLEPVDWYNRVCVKYVATGNPNADSAPSVDLTAIEVTLGPEVIPAGRKCAFTAGVFI